MQHEVERVALAYWPHWMSRSMAGLGTGAREPLQLIELCPPNGQETHSNGQETHSLLLDGLKQGHG